MTAYKVPNPDRERAERNRELKKLRKPGEPDRVARATALMLAFHEGRSINHVMELGQLVMDVADDGVAVLMDAYLDDVDGAEDQMERLSMLFNVSRWIDHDGLAQAARERGVDVAVRWCQQVSDEFDQLERVSLVERRFDEDLRRAVQERLA